MAAALNGAAGFFALLPFVLGADDLDAHADRLIASIAAAVARAAVPHVVMLSSGGADLTTGTGPITGLHRLEEALRATGTRLTALRSGHFQEKVADVIDLARATRSEQEVAEVVGRGLGRELTVDLVPAPAWAGALTEAGFRPHVAESLAELYRADEAGLLAPRGDRSVTVTTTIEETIAGLLGAGGTDPGAGERS